MVNVPMKDRCGKCWGYLGVEDKYCRMCGTKRGDGVFNIKNNVVQALYGPEPTGYKFQCRSCGLSWTENLMVNLNEFCPKCGKKQLNTIEHIEAVSNSSVQKALVILCKARVKRINSK